MLRQPRSPWPEARRVAAGGPQLPRGQGAIRGEAAGEHKAGERDAARLPNPSVGCPEWGCARARDGVWVLSCPGTMGTAASTPGDRRVAWGQLLARSLWALQVPTGEPGHGTS